MANFCLATGFTPDVYYGLTIQEYGAFIDAFEERNRR
jgi:hypothetical protein